MKTTIKNRFFLGGLYKSVCGFLSIILIMTKQNSVGILCVFHAVIRKFCQKDVLWTCVDTP